MVSLDSGVLTVSGNEKGVIMAKNLNLQQIKAFSAFCALHGLNASADDSRKKWEASLKGSDPNHKPGQRGRQKDAKVRAFVYSTSGEYLSAADVEDKEAGRLGLAVSSYGMHGDNLGPIVFTKGFVGSAPPVIRIVTPDGQIVSGYAIRETHNEQTGESESEPDSDELSEGSTESV